MLLPWQLLLPRPPPLKQLPQQLQLLRPLQERLQQL
jgi:hypothetical protein